MVEKYKLLRDLPGTRAGVIFERKIISPERPDFIVFCPPACFAPSVSMAAIKDVDWFEPVECRWTPLEGHDYWYIGTNLQVLKTFNTLGSDRERIAAGNCFRSEADGELAAEKVRECLTQFHKENQ